MASLLFTAAAAWPLKSDLDATKRLVDLTARQLQQTLRDDDLSAPSSGLTCDACKIVVRVMDVLFMENRTQDDIVEAITYLCIVLKIEDRNVCTLVVKEFQVLYIQLLKELHVRQWYAILTVEYLQWNL